jgi:hypothetical protein
LGTYLTSAAGYQYTKAEIGTATTTDFITQTALFNALQSGIQGALPIDGIMFRVADCERAFSSAKRVHLGDFLPDPCGFYVGRTMLVRATPSR